MKPLISVIASGIIAVALLDTVGSIAAKHWGFRYANLAPVSFAIYVAIGIAVGLTMPLRPALIAGLAVGAFDTTVGWGISWMIGPGRPAPEHAGPERVLKVIFTVTVLDGMLAMIGGFIAHIIVGTT